MKIPLQRDLNNEHLVNLLVCRKNIDDTVIFDAKFITGTNKVHSIIDYCSPPIWKCIVRVRQADQRAI